MKPKYGERVHLLYSDTDSLLLAIETEDVYKDMREYKDSFDFSDYSADHYLHSKENFLKVLKMKDELKSFPLIENFLLRPRMYSLMYKVNDSKQYKKSNKGVTGHVKKGIHHEDYLEALKKQRTVRKEMTVISSHKLCIGGTERVTKIVLSSFDDKRYLIDINESLPYGHYSIRKNEEWNNQSLFQSDDEEQCSEDEGSNCDMADQESMLSSSDVDVSSTNPGWGKTADIDEEDVYAPQRKDHDVVFSLLIRECIW